MEGLLYNVANGSVNLNREETKTNNRVAILKASSEVIATIY